MAKDLLNRYIWLVDTIRHHGRITRSALNECWERSSYSQGEKGIPRRTFYNYRQAVEELFSITICCDPATYEYYIEEDDSGGSRITDWLLDASATSNVLQGSRDVAERIMLEYTPSAREYLAPIIDAIRYNHPVVFDYHPYTRVNPTRGVELEPYFLRIFRQLWYVTGRNTADGKVKTYSLDRISNLHISTEVFTPPPGLTDPEVYFSDAYGIMVTRGEPKEVKLKVEARQAKYFRALPLHHSQTEEVGDSYSIFSYRLLLTDDFVQQILGYGPRVTVLAPRELRTMVTTALRESLANYGIPENPPDDRSLTNDSRSETADAD